MKKEFVSLSESFTRSFDIDFNLNFKRVKENIPQTYQFPFHFSQIFFLK